MSYETIQDRARLKAAHDIAVMEYAQGWEAMLTLRTGRQCEAELIRSLKKYFKRNLTNTHNNLPLYRSVYIHRDTNDIHAHAFIAHKYITRTVTEADAEKLKDCWLHTGGLAKISEEKRLRCSSLYYDFKLLDDPRSERGSFGEYGIKQMMKEELVYDCCEYRYEGAHARDRGERFMKRFGHTTRFQNVMSRL
jgi:hypothetical protein